MTAAPDPDAAPAAAWPGWLEPLALVLAVAFLYARAVGYGYINLDDPVFVVENPYIRSFSMDHLRAIFTPGFLTVEVLYIPLTYLSYLADVLLFGPAAWGHHLVNVLLHAANTLLLWRLLRRWLDGRAEALFGALLFAWHPLAVEPVAWVLGRKDLLAAAFVLLALLAWERQPLVWRRLPLLVALAAGAMLSKPTAIVLPGLLLLADWYRNRLPDRRRFAALGGLTTLAIAIYAVNSRAAPSSGTTVTDWLTLLALPGILGGWLRRLCLVENTHFYYLRADALAPAALTVAHWLPVLLLAALIGLAWRHRWRNVLFAVAFAAAAALPAIAVVFSDRDLITGDRYGYLSLIGVALLAGCLARPGWRRPSLAAAIAACLLAGGLAWHTLPAWRNAQTLWSRVLDRSPHHPVAHVALGNALDDAGRPGEARQHYLAALRARPDFPLAHNNLGNLLLRAGDPLLAARHYRYATVHAAGYTDAWANLGLALAQAGHWPDALAAIDRALALVPGHPAARYHRAMVLLELDRLDEAESDFRRVIEGGRQTGPAWYGIAQIAIRRRQTPAAVIALSQAIEADMTLAPAYLALARIMLDAAQPARAIVVLEHGLDACPGDAALEQLLETARQHPASAP